MKKFFFFLMSLTLFFLSCSKEDDSDIEGLQDEYYVKYENKSSHFGQPKDFSYFDVDNSIKTADKEIAIGPVRKGFVAKMFVSTWPSGRTLTISISKNSSPWLVKESKKLSADDYSITYTIDF